jgi:hypothetical protein
MTVQTNGEKTQNTILEWPADKIQRFFSMQIVHISHMQCQ